jgi:hypothetical protein
LGIEVDCPFTSGVLKKVTYAATHASSFAQAARNLSALSETPVSAKRVERWSKRVGEERLAEVDRQAESHQQLPLPEQRQSPTSHVPQVACVMVDGGRIQIRDRRHPTPPDQSHWKETLVGCCLRMQSEEYDSDPCPRLPSMFVDPARMSDLSREIKGFSSETGEEEAVRDAPHDQPGRPKVLVKSVVATRQGQQVFGRRLVADAYHRGFAAARRKAFVADGAANNWSIHRQHFSHYTPIVDFTHAICYVYAAALAGRCAKDGWQTYRQWAQWLWEGSTEALIAAVAERSSQLGQPAKDDTSSSAAIVHRTLTYLRNQKSRMKYAKYRKLGLPITSSHIESTIKQVNRRVKGTEKFWHAGAEPLLQLAADHLSQTTDFDQFWRRRTKNLPTARSYRTNA